MTSSLYVYLVQLHYDLVTICVSSLPDIILNAYTYVPFKNPTNTRHSGVALFYKNSLHIKIGNDLSFDESIVVESISRRKIFFTDIQEAFNHTFPEFINSCQIYSKIKNENPFLS